jgi:hypothetical protein
MRERMARAPSTHCPTDCPEPYGLEHPAYPIRTAASEAKVTTDRG